MESVHWGLPTLPIHRRGSLLCRDLPFAPGNGAHQWRQMSGPVSVPTGTGPLFLAGYAALPVSAPVKMVSNVRNGWKADITRCDHKRQLEPMTKLSILFSLILWLLVTPAAGEPTPRCGLRWGQPAKPLVASAKTATDIFLAVEREFFPRADKVHYPDVSASDEGSWWSVSRGSPARIGGGQLSMHIDKCTGAISHVFLTK